MLPSFICAPRYRLDDPGWLQGIDPLRRYWLWANADPEWGVALPGLMVADLAQLREAIGRFRALQPGERLNLPTAGEPLAIFCVSSDCFMVAGPAQMPPTSHLFDREALESLLMTAHPDWLPAERDLALGSRVLERAFQDAAVA